MQTLRDKASASPGPSPVLHKVDPKADMKIDVQEIYNLPSGGITLQDRVEHAIDARSGVLPQAVLQQRLRLAAATQRALVDILRTVFGKELDTGSRRVEHPPLTENEIVSLQVCPGSPYLI